MNESAHSRLGMVETLRHNFKGFSQLYPNVTASLKFAADDTRQHDPCKITL